MHNVNTQIKDLTEMERLIIGSSLNFVFNILNSQIDHIENHDPKLTELLITNEVAQEDFILLQSLRDITENLTNLFGETFSKISDEEKDGLTKPALKLEMFFTEIYYAITCGDNN